MENREGQQFKGSYIPQELLKEIQRLSNRLTIGIPRETEEGERRLALTPEAVEMLTGYGHRVLLESGAGLGINYSDNRYAEAGAEIVETAQELFQADIILKILPPTVEEVAMARPRAIFFSLIQLNRFQREAFELMAMKRITAVSYELMADETGRIPILGVTSEIEGAAAITIASELLSNEQGGKGILFGGMPGLSPTEVVIIGAGNAGTVAARAAQALGASVKVFDDDINKLRAIQNLLGRELFTSTFHPNVLLNAFKSADVVIGAMRYINTRHRYVIAEELIQQMKKGALVIDLRVTQGGCFETTCCLGENDPQIFEQYGVLHYCKPNISNRVARTTSMAYSNILVPFLTRLGDAGSLQMLIKNDRGLRQGIYLYAGKPVAAYVAEHFNVPCNNINLYLSAF